MIEITLTQFTPGQAEKITGVSVVQQRNLRRHDYLESRPGHARFNLLGVSRLAFIQAMGDRGIGPSQIAKLGDRWDIASIAALGIAWEILSSKEAFEGDLDAFPLGIPPRAPLSNEEIAHTIAEADRLGIRLTKEDILSDWGHRADLLKKTIFTDLNFPPVRPERFFVWWANGEHSWENDLARAFLEAADSPLLQGAAIVLDQRAVAGLLLERAAGPFAHVEEIADK